MYVSKACWDNDKNPDSIRRYELEEAPEVNRTALGFCSLSPCLPHYFRRLTPIKAVKSIKHFCLLEDITRCVPLRFLILCNSQQFIQ